MLQVQLERQLGRIDELRTLEQVELPLLGRGDDLVVPGLPHQVADIHQRLKQRRRHDRIKRRQHPIEVFGPVLIKRDPVEIHVPRFAVILVRPKKPYQIIRTHRLEKLEPNQVSIDRSCHIAPLMSVDDALRPY